MMMSEIPAFNESRERTEAEQAEMYICRSSYKWYKTMTMDNMTKQIFKRRGPRTELWGTPWERKDVEDLKSWTAMNKCLLVR